MSFNLDAFSSYGKEQGANAPTSEAAAFRYGAALNRMLDRGSRNRIARPIGDASVVFWADTSAVVDETAAKAAEDAFAAWFDQPAQGGQGADDASEAAKLRDALNMLAKAVLFRISSLGLVPGTRFHVLGLAPTPHGCRCAIGWTTDFEAFAAAWPITIATSPSSRRHGAQSRRRSSGCWSRPPHSRRNSTISRRCWPAR